MTRDAGLYLGRRVDPATGELLADEVRLDPGDLTTHAVVIGMTGSGKTGLCLSLLEELALQGIPALAVDPKGDLGNLLLTFPELSPSDFAAWLPPGEAERLGLTPERYAAQVAEQWRSGLAEWGLDGGRIRALRERVSLAVYTPGSRAGIPVNVLSSFAPPDLSWDGDEEALLESIRLAVSGLLSLLGVEADPLQSREHIFLSQLVEAAWRAARPCDLSELIRGLQQPPFAKLGVFAAAVRADLDALQAELEADVAAIDSRHAAGAARIQTVQVPLERDDVRVETLGVLWIPMAST